eukprot:gnl/TRDRNA2_/TRDRNA2_176717_c4_seq1.p1 gnl/TRDRNA2_/TRDRNA2_176717_c4~~gnl/TRDRNA2_/TRDRNA2_176717_c4_seq1.p1  ORF type:complete len:272 (-),score=42.75 gnl/TRDRNA2_/TRDRNA2_176717_c4_seq1:305-1120(-)
MLIGVLCEVVSAVAATEKEGMAVEFVRDNMLLIVQNIDQNGDCQISRKEFSRILENREACCTLQKVGIDPIGIVDFTDIIFEDPDAEEDAVGDDRYRELDFSDFMEEILNFRDSETATVKHFVDLQKVVRATVRKLGHRVQYVMGRSHNKLHRAATTSNPKLLGEPCSSSDGRIRKSMSTASLASASPCVSKAPNHSQNRSANAPFEAHSVEAFLQAELKEIQKHELASSLPGMLESNDSTAELRAWSAQTAKLINRTLDDLHRIRERRAG